MKYDNTLIYARVLNLSRDRVKPLFFAFKISFFLGIDNLV